MHRQTQDSYRGCLLRNLSGRDQPVHFRHIDVHNYHVGMQFQNLLNSFSPVSCFTDDFGIGFVYENPTNAVSYHRMVVGNQYPYLISHLQPACSEESQNPLQFHRFDWRPRRGSRLG